MTDCSCVEGHTLVQIGPIDPLGNALFNLCENAGVCLSKTQKGEAKR